MYIDNNTFWIVVGILVAVIVVVYNVLVARIDKNYQDLSTKILKLVEAITHVLKITDALEQEIDTNKRENYQDLSDAYRAMAGLAKQIEKQKQKK